MAKLKGNNLTELVGNYTKPTPVKWRKLGDSLLGVSTTITGFAIANDTKWLAMSALVLGVAGKFLSNFFTEDTVV